MLLRDNSCRTPQNDALDPSMFDDLTKNDLENGVKGKHFQEPGYISLHVYKFRMVVHVFPRRLVDSKFQLQYYPYRKYVILKSSMMSKVRTRWKNYKMRKYANRQKSWTTPRLWEKMTWNESLRMQRRKLKLTWRRIEYELNVLKEQSLGLIFEVVW